MAAGWPLPAGRRPWGAEDLHPVLRGDREESRHVGRAVERRREDAIDRGLADLSQESLEQERLEADEGLASGGAGDEGVRNALGTEGESAGRQIQLGVAHVALGEDAPASGGAAFAALHVNADVTAELGRYRRYLSRSPDRTLILTLETRDLPTPVAMMLNSLNVPMDWNDGMSMANWVTTGREVRWILRDAADRRENMDIRWRFPRGSLVKLRIFNDPTSVHAMAHPIHLHGQRFLILARNGVPNDNMAWKDTGLIPAGETVDLLVDMANPGTWLLHCHVAEHMGAGMMSTFRVE